MMNNKGKYIGLNQRIPFEVLDLAIQNYLDSDVVDKSKILQHMLIFTSGVNRANKASNYVVQILSRQESLLKKIKKSLKQSTFESLSNADRKALSLSLISLTYPITYDLLVALAQGFKVQTQINKKFINEKVMAIYGSNRTVDIAIDALLPMLIELSTIKRDKVSIYSLANRLAITNKFIQELIIYTDIKLSSTKSILVDDLGYRPWFTYFDLPQTNNYQYLVSKKDSAVGRGYLTL
ncbi:hypothetical protein [Adhaeribacter soli]|uniref:DUF1819 family protein n=1 Tax=Adhaeribacter soli TaxID=2607655 RepID=A0A5N1IRF1_9BACT|nr:hypothetical protein [Adhaeribacter soli]KAA9332674.1 hypothetical protein F0P94_11745 [Adhaeribacter soli]